jgi:hypothetical protein
MKARLTVPALLTVFAVAVAAAGVAGAASVQPHEAIYDITVREWKLPGPVSSYTGTQILRLESTCRAWRLSGRFGIAARLQNGRGLKFESEISSLEAKDGSRLTFDHKTRLDGRDVAPIRGVATRPGPGQAGRIRLSLPKDHTLALPKEALFPVASFLWTAAQVQKGARTMNYILFDGSHPEPLRVFELLTGTPEALSPPPKGDTQLLEGPAWRTVGSFHRYSGTGAEPLTTVTQNIHANGIGSEITFDIGLAVVQLKLRAIRQLPEPSC